MAGPARTVKPARTKRSKRREMRSLPPVRTEGSLSKSVGERAVPSYPHVAPPQDILQAAGAWCCGWPRISASLAPGRGRDAMRNLGRRTILLDRAIATAQDYCGLAVLLAAEILPIGEAFFTKYGWTGIAIARFLPGVRAIVPVVAGTSGMKPVPFYAANIASAIVWAPAHLLPAAFAGLGLGFINQISPQTEVELVIGAVNRTGISGGCLA